MSSAHTLLISPPSLSSQPEKLKSIILDAEREYGTIELQMLDRLALGIVSLPSSAYDTALLLADVDCSRQGSRTLADRGVVKSITQALKPGGRLINQHGIDGLGNDMFQTEAVLAGLMNDEKGGFMKPDFGAQQLVHLRPAKKKQEVDRKENGQHFHLVEARSGRIATPGKIDFSDDFTMLNPGRADNLGDDLIDEDDLLGEDDLNRPIVQRKWISRHVYICVFDLLIGCSF